MFERSMQDLHSEYKEEFSQIFQIQDDIGVVLRLHLLTEQVVENFICAVCNQPNMFWFIEGKNESKITVSYDHKLKIAKTLGLPDAVYKVFQRLNTMRNKLAHRIGHGTIDSGALEGLMDVVKNEIEPKMGTPLSKTWWLDFNELGEIKSQLFFVDAESDCGKLALLVRYTFIYFIVTAFDKFGRTQN